MRPTRLSPCRDGKRHKPINAENMPRTSTNIFRRARRAKTRPQAQIFIGGNGAANGCGTNANAPPSRKPYFKHGGGKASKAQNRQTNAAEDKTDNSRKPAGRCVDAKAKYTIKYGKTKTDIASRRIARRAQFICVLIGRGVDDINAQAETATGK